MLDPNQQLMAARGLLDHQSGGGLMQSAYISEVERNAAATSAGILNTGVGLATNAPLVLGTLGTMMMRGRVGNMIGGAMSSIDPFGAAFQNVPKLFSGQMGLGAVGVSIGGAALAGYGIQQTGSFVREQMLQGQRNFLASRALMRNLPQIGFGDQSVLSPGAAPMGNHQASLLNQSIQSIAGQYGMSAGQTRNLMGTMAGAGMINTTSVQQMSSSFRSSLQELKQLAKQIGGDIQEAMEVYKAIDRMGFKSSGGRQRVLRSMTTTSAMTGMSLSDVHANMQATLATADQMGINRHAAVNIANRSMQTAAYMSQQGTIDNDYLRQTGGMSGFSQRMGQIEMSVAQSRGGLAMMSNLFTPYGAVRKDAYGSLMSGNKAQMRYSALQEMDPYAMSDMTSDMTRMMGGVILSRVNKIRMEHASNPLKARREQYSFLSSMGISDPKEQLQYLSYLRAKPTSDFMASMQDLRNTTISARDGSYTDPQKMINPLKSAIESVTQSLSQTFQRAGEAVLRDWESTNRRVSQALQPGQRRYVTGAASVEDMRSVARDLSRGDYDFSTGFKDVYRTLDTTEMRRAFGASVDVRGMDALTRQSLLKTRTDRFLYASADISGGINRGIAQGYDLLFDTGAPVETRGAMAEQLPGGYGAGDIYMGRNRSGRAAYGSTGTLMEMMARDMGGEFDSATGRVITLNQRQAARLSSVSGTQFSRDFNRTIGAPLSQRLKKDDQRLFGVGGGYAAGLTGLGIGAYYGAMYGSALGPWGTAGGAVLGGLGGALLGFFGGQAIASGTSGDGLYGTLNEYSDEQGVAEPALSKSQREQIKLNRNSILMGPAGNQLSMSLFGKEYSKLSGQERLQMHEMMRRHGGEIGTALAGEDKSGSLDQDQFLAMVSQQSTRIGLENFFEVGGQKSVANFQRAAERGTMIDVSAAALAGMSDKERRALFDMQAKGTRFGSRLYMSHGYAMASAEGSVTNVGRAYKGLSALARNDPGLAKRISTSHKGGMYITPAGVHRELERLALAGADVEELAEVRAQFEGVFAEAGTGAYGDMAIVGKERELSQRGALFEGIDSLLSPEMLEDEGSRIREGSIGRAAGVASAISALLDVGAESSLSDAALESAIGTVSGRKFGSGDQRASALGTLVEARTLKRIGGAQLPEDQYQREVQSTIDEMVKAGIISRSDANSIQLGGVSRKNLQQLMQNIPNVGAEGRRGLQNQEKTLSLMAQNTTQLQFQAIKNNQVKNIMAETMSDRAQDFEGLIGGLAASAGGGGLFEGIGGGLSGMQKLIQDAKDSGVNLFDYIREGGPETQAQLSGFRDEIKARMDQLKGSNPADRSKLEMLQQVLGQLDNVQGLAYGERDFMSLVSQGATGAIINKGGKLSLDTGGIQQRMRALSPEALAGALGGSRIQALQKLMGGVQKDTDRATLLSHVSGATGLQGDEMMRAVVGTFSAPGALKDMRPEDIESEYKRLLQDTKKPQGDQIVTELERALTRILASSDLDIEGSEKKKEAGKKQEKMAEDIATTARILTAAFDGGGALKVRNIGEPD